MKKISLFRKFTLLIILTTIIVVSITQCVIIVYFRDIRSKLPVSKGIQRITQFLATQIDITNEDSTRSFLNELGMDLRYIGTNFEWCSSNTVPTLQTVQNKAHGKSGFWLNNRYVSIIKSNDNIYIFQGFTPFKHFDFPWTIALLWSTVMIGVFGIVHLTIHTFLKPLRILQKGVIQAGKGDFNIELSQTTNDELGQLIHSFNTMALQVRNDIKSRDQLLRDISHEFRSPLARMMVGLEFIPDGNIRHMLKNNIHILEKMTSTILEEERIDSPFGKIRREEIDLKAMLSEIATNRNTSKKLMNIISDEPLKILADKERILIALSNVIDNAIKYSTNESKPVDVVYTKINKEVTIIVTDYGIGIPEADLPFIFEPFYRVDKARKHTSGGYGLGMSLTKKIIDAHNGRIVIESIQNHHTTVTITLPVV